MTDAFGPLALTDSVCTEDFGVLVNKLLSLIMKCIRDHYRFILLLQQFFMWIESNTPELAVPYLWSEEKQSSEYIDLSYSKMVQHNY